MPAISRLNQFDEMPPPSTPLLADVANANSYTGFGYNIGVTCSALNLATWRTLQELVGGDTTPEELIATNQQVYEEDCLCRRVSGATRYGRVRHRIRP